MATAITGQLLNGLAAELKAFLEDVETDARLILDSENVNYTDGTKNGLFSEAEANVAALTVDGAVGSRGPGAVFANYGRRKNKPMPPDAPIREWLRVKKGVPEGPELDRATFLVRRKIARKGSPGSRFLDRALEGLEPSLTPRLARAADRALDGVQIV